MGIIKKVLVFLPLLTLAVGCATTYPSRDQRSNETGRTVEAGSAYFYGTFTHRHAGRLGVLFREQETGDKHRFIMRRRTPERMLIAVPPGTYRNDFDIYSFDVVYWYVSGYYDVPGKLKQHFEVEPGIVYYVGEFTGDLYAYDFADAQTEFREKHPQFSGLPFRGIYGDSVDGISP